MFLPGTADALRVARYGAKPFGPAAGTTPWTPDAVVNVTDIKRVARLAADANDLPVFPNGNYSCPSSDGSHYELQFSFANGDRRPCLRKGRVVRVSALKMRRTGLARRSPGQ